MSELNVRGLDADTLGRLSARAKLAGQSREAFLRDMLIDAAIAESISDKTRAQREGRYPFSDGSPEDIIAGRAFMLGFTSAFLVAVRNGVPETDAVAALLGRVAPEALTSQPVAPTPAAAADAAKNRAAAPHGVQVVSREYSVGA